MKSILIAGLLTLTLAGSSHVVCGAEGAAAPAATAKSSEKKAKYMPFRGKVASVDLAARTITLAGKTKSRTFQLTNETRIHRDGQPAVLEDVRNGAMVGGRARATDTGGWDVVVLNLGIKGAKDPEKAAEPAPDDSME